MGTADASENHLHHLDVLIIDFADRPASAIFGTKGFTARLLMDGRAMSPRCGLSHFLKQSCHDAAVFGLTGFFSPVNVIEPPLSGRAKCYAEVHGSTFSSAPRYGPRLLPIISRAFLSCPGASVQKRP